VLDTLDTIKIAAGINGDPITRILNIGYRPSSNPLAQQWCESNKVFFEVLEVFGRNAVWSRHAGIKTYLMDVRDLLKANVDIGEFDFILWLHGPEHIPWGEFLELRHTIESMSQYGVIYQAPVGECRVHPEYYGNPAEAHQEDLWPFQFAQLGYVTVNHVSDAENCFSAIRIKSCE
jgi:hypothetical protein